MKPKTKPAGTGIIKFTSVKNYINEVEKMRIGKDAVNKYIVEFDDVQNAVIKEAKRLALEEKRSTILKPDIAAALEKYLRRKNLPWTETAKEVIKHNPTDLGKISNAIRTWIQEHEKPFQTAGGGLNKLNQGQLAAAIAGKFNLQLTETGEIIDFLIAQVAQDLRAGRRTYFRGFASFVKKTRPGRHVRHPKTGQLIWIPPRPDVDFNPAKGLLKAKRR
ncbi:MAG: HU family DNA-binding protein [Elusimicrobiota bacterium]|nr:HU family DNA-binding protein [Elusimicrobiota bacterium]